MLQKKVDKLGTDLDETERSLREATEK